MKIVFISDIHSNLPALEAVVKKIDEIKPDKIICLGDIVGYGPYPNECIKIISEKSDIVLLGNHDAAVIDRLLTDDFNLYAKTAIEYNKTIINKESYLFLQELYPFKKIEIENFKIALAHASYINPLEEYVLGETIAEHNLKAMNENFLFIGHTHYPVYFVKNNISNDVKLTGYLKDNQFHEHNKYIFNVGSVGQPRDGDPRACFLLFDTHTKIFNLIRVEYDIEKIQNKIRKEFLPEYLAKRLSLGR